MSRVYNFSAGPSMLPEAVLRRAAGEMLDYEGSGQSVMEMSHRSKVYDGSSRKHSACCVGAWSSRQLQGASHAGRRIFPICHGADEPDDWFRKGGLCPERAVCDEGL